MKDMEECYRCEFISSCNKSGCADRGYITICKEKYNKLLEKMSNLEEDLIHKDEDVFCREQRLLDRERELEERERKLEERALKLKELEKTMINKNKYKRLTNPNPEEFNIKIFFCGGCENYNYKTNECKEEHLWCDKFRSFEETYNRLKDIEDDIENKKLIKQLTCRNETRNHPVDEFICSNCGFMTEDFSKLEIDEEDGDRCHCEFEIKYCPCCGAKVIE